VTPLSQVIIANDDLNLRRAEAAKQEHRITIEKDYAKWRRSDVVGFDPIKVAVGIAVLPIVAFWSFLTACFGYAFGITATIFRVIGGLIGNSKKKL